MGCLAQERGFERKRGKKCRLHYGHFRVDGRTDDGLTLELLYVDEAMVG